MTREDPTPKDSASSDEDLAGPPPREATYLRGDREREAERHAARALGVPRGPDEPVRTSDEILQGRDEHRWQQEDNERE